MEIHRSLSGKMVARALKDGQYLSLEMTSGEIFRLAWVSPNGDGYVGEPRLVRVDVSITIPGVGAGGLAGAP
jgi:hypothetical protein